MAVAPGTNPGDTTQINGVEYTWDGVSWSKTHSNSTVDTSDVLLTNPTRNSFLSLNQSAINFPDTSGAVTQEDANRLLLEISEWIKDQKADVLLQSNTPDVNNYDDGTLWVDQSVYDLFVLDAGQWIQVLGTL